MDQPIRCYTCSSILHPLMYKQYSDALEAKKTSEVALREVKDLNRKCLGCSSMILSHLPIAENQFYMVPQPRPVSFYHPLTQFMSLHDPKPQEFVPS